jgi:2-polyprenyl-6-methoxyphenol hydroxylase-like FAD-dependent oxidoreductase
MVAIGKVLVIGGGFSGMAAAIELRKIGIEVDLVEIDKTWRSYGAGITISGPTLRAFQTVGILPAVLAQGYCSDDCEICTADGRLVRRISTPRVAGADVPSSGGIMRSILAKIMAEATLASGTHVRLGCSFNSIESGKSSVAIGFTDGTSASYELVIGADGVHSSVRSALWPEAPRPQYTGQGVWRALLPRPPAIVCATMFLGERHKVGVNPVSDQEMYLFLTEDRARNERIPESHWLPELHALLGEFSAPLIRTIRDSIGAHSRIVYRPLESLLLPLPWSKARVLLTGDAVHATTPHLASGAGIGVEDAIVLSQELAKATTLAAALSAFESRRFERCRLVCENSLRLGVLERTGGSQQEHAELMHRSMMTLAEPI